MEMEDVEDDPPSDGNQVLPMLILTTNSPRMQADPLCSLARPTERSIPPSSGDALVAAEDEEGAETYNIVSKLFGI